MRASPHTAYLINHYVNEAEIDGLGYVHAPIGPILLALLTQIMAVIAIISQSMG